MRRRSIRIEKRPVGYSVVRYRDDGVGVSLGLVKTKKAAKALKRKNLFGKKTKMHKNGGHYHTKKNPKGLHAHPMYEMKHRHKRKSRK